MAQLQYIGARYVPKFYENSLDPTSMDWESGRGYEALTLVTYNSDTYTSKIPVPSTVGAPDANPIYWVKTADYNAAITAINAALSALTDKVNDVEDIATGNTKFNEKMVVKLYDHIKVFGGSSDNWALQGGCYNPTRNSVVFVLLNNTDSTTAKLIEVDATDFTTVIQSAVVAQSDIGHGNSMTYNPLTNKYYVATGRSATNYPNELRVYKASDLSFDSTVTLSPAIAPTAAEGTWHITYDSITDQYIARNETAIQIYDAAFNLVDTIPFAKADTIINGLSASGSVNACACMFDKYYAVQNYILTASQYGAKTISFYDLDGTCVGSTALSTDFVTDEAEFMVNINGIIFVIGQGSFYTVKMLIPSDMNGESFGHDFYSGAIPLTGSENIDDLLIVGKYNVNNSTIAASLGVPVSSGGILTVKQAYGNRIVQTYEGYHAGSNEVPVFYRQYYAGSWSNWSNIGDCYVAGEELSVGTATFIGYSAASNKILFFIPLSKSAMQISSVSVTAGNFFFRGNGERVNITGSGSSFTYADITATLHAHNKLGIELEITPNPSGDWYLGANVMTALTTLYCGVSGLKLQF